MMSVDNNKAGLAMGTLLGLWHLLWVVLVAVGLAQPLLNFIFMVHFLANPYKVEPFGFKRALALVVITSGIGYMIGWIFAWLWNYFHRQMKTA